MSLYFLTEVFLFSVTIPVKDGCIATFQKTERVYYAVEHTLTFHFTLQLNKHVQTFWSVSLCINSSLFPHCPGTKVSLSISLSFHIFLSS